MSGADTAGTGEQEKSRKRARREQLFESSSSRAANGRHPRHDPCGCPRVSATESLARTRRTAELLFWKKRKRLAFSLALIEQI